MQPIDHAMNYSRDTALDMTSCLWKGIPSLLGMPGGQAPPLVVSDWYVTVLTLLYIARSPAFNGVVFKPWYGTRKAQGDQMSLKQVRLIWRLRSAICCISSCPHSSKWQLAIRSCIPPWPKATCHRAQTSSHPTQDPSPPSHGHPAAPILPTALLSLHPPSWAVHLFPPPLPTSLLCFSAHSLGGLKGASQHPLTPAPHVPPACLSSRCKRSKRTAKIAEGEELVGLTSGGQKQLLLLSRQEVKEEG